jgi:CubicO group peptidase (beta-lactamase class C family)
MRDIRLFVMFVALTLVSNPLSAQRPAWAPAVDSIVRSELALSGTPGGQIAIVEHGRLVYSAGYGVADVETGRPVTGSTLFQLAGVTDVFTAALLAELHARGAIDLDSSIRRYLPDIPGARTGAATARGLLSMSSGWIGTGDFFGPQDESALSRVYGATGDTVVMTEPGRVFSYSNAGYAVAGLVAERAARRPFADLMDSVILRPLGMPFASYRPAQVASRDFSQPHGGPAAQPARVQRPAPSNFADWPAGFLYASAGEVARLTIALMKDGIVDGRQALRPEATRQMTRGVIPVVETVVPDTFALGIHVMTDRGRRVWEKNGGMPGWDSEVTMWPDDGFAIVVNFNRHTDLQGRVTDAIAQRVAGIPPRPTVDLAGERDPTAEERAALVGKYGQRVAQSEYLEQDGALRMRIGGMTLPVRMTSDGKRVIVRLPSGPPRVSFVVRDSTGAVRYLVRDGKAYMRQ